MKPISEYLYELCERFPPSLRDRGPLLVLRDRLRLREIERRTAPLTAHPTYRDEIEAEEFKVLFVSPFYLSYPLLIPSLLEQSYRNWKLILVHDGNASGLTSAARGMIECDPRIHFLETTERADDWGHTPRQIAFEAIGKGIGGDFIVVTNSDNYHVPGYARLMLERFEEEVEAVHCDMVHDYYSWRNCATRPEYSFIDCACLMTRRDAALEVGWTDNSYEGDWKYIDALLQRYGKRAFRHLPAPLFVHN